MSKLDKLLRELCPNGVEYKRIGDFAMCFPGATPKTTHPEYWENGTIPWMSSGEVNQEEVTFTEKKITQKGYDETSTKMVPVGTVVIALAGQGKTRGKVAITRIPLCTNQSLCAIVVDETVISKYLFHYLRSQYARIREISSGDGTRGGLNLKMIKAYVVPVPPIEVQEEIVRILDSYTEKIDELTQNLMTEITARNTQYGYYRDKLLKAETNAHKYKLGEIATVTKLAGFEFTNYVTYSENGNIIALRGLNVKNGRLDLHDVKYVDKSDFSKLERSKLHIGDMLFTYVGTVGQVAIVEEEDKYYLAPNVALIRCDKEVLLPQYMKYYFQTTQFWDKQIRRLLQSSSMQNIPMEKIRKFEIAVPPLDVQNRIVNVLDNFEKICADLNIGLPAEIEARQKQYEYYRDKLLTFAETGNTILSRAEQSRACLLYTSHELFDEAVKRYNAKQKRKDRCITDYYEHLRTGKQEKLFHELIVQIGNKDDMGVLTENGALAKELLDEYMQGFQERNPTLRVFGAFLHMEDVYKRQVDFLPKEAVAHGIPSQHLFCLQQQRTRAAGQMCIRDRCRCAVGHRTSAPW